LAVELPLFRKDLIKDCSKKFFVDIESRGKFGQAFCSLI
jgi:hypothetical protein